MAAECELEAAIPALPRGTEVVLLLALLLAGAGILRLRSALAGYGR